MANALNETPGFFSTIWSLFKGPGVLVNLYTSSPFRAVLRLLVLTFLCTIFYAIAVTITENYKGTSVLERFKRTAGDLVITSNRIAFSVNPEQSRVMKLKRFNIGYFPHNSFKSEFFAPENDSFGIEILDQYAVIWFATTQKNNDDNLYNVLLVTPQDFSTLLAGHMGYPMNKFYTRQEFIQTLCSNSNENLDVYLNSSKKQNPSILTYSADDLYRVYIFVWGLLSFMQSLFYDVILLTLTVFLVSIVQMLYSGAKPQSLKIGQAITITVYSSFVALIVATILTIPETQFLSFTSIFFILFMIYQFTAFSKIQHILNSTHEKNE